MEKSTNQEQATQFVGIKAGYMGAILGGEPHRDELVKHIDSFENAAVRFVAAQTIDHLSPEGVEGSSRGPAQGRRQKRRGRRQEQDGRGRPRQAGDVPHRGPRRLILGDGQLGKPVDGQRTARGTERRLSRPRPRAGRRRDPNRSGRRPTSSSSPRPTSRPSTRGWWSAPSA